MNHKIVSKQFYNKVFWDIIKFWDIIVKSDTENENVTILIDSSNS